MQLPPKLRNRYSVNGAVARWIEDWLKDRQQRVILNGQASAYTKVTSGVIQGSSLGPILALMMLDSIDEVLMHCHASKFADDNKV